MVLALPDLALAPSYTSISLAGSRAQIFVATPLERTQDFRKGERLQRCPGQKPNLGGIVPGLREIPGLKALGHEMVSQRDTTTSKFPRVLVRKVIPCGVLCPLSLGALSRYRGKEAILTSRHISCPVRLQ